MAKTSASRLLRLAKDAKLQSDNVSIFVGVNNDLGNGTLWVAAYIDGGEFVQLDGFFDTQSEALAALEKKLL